MDVLNVGLGSLIDATAQGLREKRDSPGRWCNHFTEDCILKMQQYGESGYLCEHNCEYCKTFKWAVDRAKHYAEKLELPYLTILQGWERDRDYWYLNYYQDCKQPQIKEGSVRVFDTLDDYRRSLEGKGFRCPKCSSESDAPYECTCGWKSYGLLGTLGKGITVFIKDSMAMSHIFMPIAWEVQYAEDM